MIKHIVRKEFTDVVRDGRFRWCAALVGALLLVSLGHGWVQALLWLALAAWVNSLRRSSAWNATVLVGAWLVLVVVLPAAVNIAAGLLHPLPSRVEMITAQREASNDAVNRRSELLARYLEDHPEMAGGVVADESCPTCRRSGSWTRNPPTSSAGRRCR